MIKPSLDIVAIGNAIVDVIAPASEAFLASENLPKGSMRLIDANQAIDLYGKMAAATEISGGSAANTIAGMAALGQRCGFIGQVAPDQLGDVFSHDVRAIGVNFETAPIAGEPTGRCLILVTPDGQRTMNTFLGAAQLLPTSAIDHSLIESAAVLYLEGYLWNAETPRAAMLDAINCAHGAGRKVALTLSDAFVIDLHRADFIDLIGERKIDILFANEVEICSLAQTEDFDAAVAAIAPDVPMLIVTRGSHGAIAVSNGERVAVHAEPIDKVIDTTGAGDLFAAGFLSGQAQGRSIADSLTMGAICAAEIISHVGPRPEADIKALVATRLG